MRIKDMNPKLRKRKIQTWFRAGMQLLSLIHISCNIATQAIAQIASSQYGGQSISLAHLAPFVQVSREKMCIRDSTELRSLSGIKLIILSLL